MKLLLAFFGLLMGIASGETYRYILGVNTGLQKRVVGKDGTSTSISFSKDSNAEARFLLGQLLELEGINGTDGKDDWNGVTFGQAIIVHGTFEPGVLRTESAPNTAAAEEYRRFMLEKIEVKFPLVRQRPGKVFGTGYLETHFGFETLFPDGLMFEGRELDLRRYTAKGG